MLLFNNLGVPFLTQSFGCQVAWRGKY